ncbi:MAG: hypothetical protein IPM66_08765 [Acidobacteriota bacterium]|nr:MAG: hypothetical protein IPM66_08765 [Acidobacteriota bacterium]
MTHFLALILFALLVSIAFAVLSSEHHTAPERVRYGLKVFVYFVGIGYLVAWVLFPLPL